MSRHALTVALAGIFVSMLIGVFGPRTPAGLAALAVVITATLLGVLAVERRSPGQP